MVFCHCLVAFHVEQNFHILTYPHPYLTSEKQDARKYYCKTVNKYINTILK